MIRHSFTLFDGSIIICDSFGAKRYSQKTFWRIGAFFILIKNYMRTLIQQFVSFFQYPVNIRKKGDKIMQNQIKNKK